MTQEKYEAHFSAKKNATEKKTANKEDIDDDFVHIDKDTTISDATEENRTTKRARNQVSQTNGSGPSFHGPILVVHGGAANQEGHAIEVIIICYSSPNIVSNLFCVFNSSHIVIKHSCINSSVVYLVNITMRVLSWNFQGFTSKTTRDHLKDLIYRYNLDIIFISEAKISEGKMRKLIKPYKYPNSKLISYVGLAGGLILLWKRWFPL